ncbi:hypothetical protein V9Z29_06075 [Streptococcus suis]|uniref:hypothetical protein n=1 Tax=Streptococcus suis TaxID=1307 RepID=UPI003010107A
MNKQKIITELKKIHSRIKSKGSDEFVRAYFDQEINLWAILKPGNSFGEEVAEFLSDEQFEKRFEVFEGTLFYHDRRECE